MKLSKCTYDLNGRRRFRHAKFMVFFLTGAVLAAAMGAGAVSTLPVPGDLRAHSNVNAEDSNRGGGAREYAALQSSIINHQSSTTSPSSSGGRSQAAPAVFDLYFPGEFETIRRAAIRNGCEGEDFIILLAVRFAENGGPGRQFGVLDRRAVDTDLDTQAGWAAATIAKNRQRWIDSGGGGNYLDFLAGRYCPASVDPVGCDNWRVNTGYWYLRLSSQL